MRWVCLPFDGFTPSQLYEVLALRSAVFVVEQQCVFQDIDGLDPQVQHLLAYRDDGRLAAYLRLVPPGLKQPDALISRVVTAPHARGQGLGRPLMERAITECERLWPSQAISLHGQAHLERFYASFGFSPVGELYVEDGIPHIEMQRLPKDTP